MKNYIYILIVLFSINAAKAQNGTEETMKIKNKTQDVFTSIPFQDQQMQGYLGIRMKKNIEERLLKVDEEELLGGYLQRPGKHEWIGEHIGKYLEAACNAWMNTNNPMLKEQMDRMAIQLIGSQLADGYMGTYPPEGYWTGWDVWSHKYNLYGLLAFYNTTGYTPALDACVKMGDLLCLTFGKEWGKRDIIKSGTHVGMAATSILEPMVDLYKCTRDKKYLDFCYYLIDAWEQDNGPKIIGTLLSVGKVNKVANGKAYEMLSNLVGLVKLYQVTGDTYLLKPVEIAWLDIISNRLYITGTTSSKEFFQEDYILPQTIKDNVGEGCVTTTWLQLNKGLFEITGELKYFNEIEKTIYNHLLGAENPRTGCVSYFTPMTDKKGYTCEIACCTSSIPRGIAMIPYFTFGNVKNIPTVLIYEPATYKERYTTTDGKQVELSIQIESDFPAKDNAVIIVNTSQTTSFPLYLRVPAWCENYTAKIEGKDYKGKSDEYLVINRTWKSGDKINISFKTSIQEVNGGTIYPNLMALRKGPQVLAYDSSLNSQAVNDLFNPEQKIAIEKVDQNNKPDLLPCDWIGKQAYTLTAKKTGQKMALVPFADASQTSGMIKVWMPLKKIQSEL